MQTASAKDAVKALVMPVLPRTPRGHKGRIAMLLAPPGRHALCDACRTMLTFDIQRSAMVRQQPPQPLDDICRCDRAGTEALQARSRVFINAGEALQPSSIGRLGMDQVIAPDMLGMRRTGGRGRAWAPGAPLTRWLDDWQPLVLADAAYGLAMHSPLCSLSQVVKLPIPKARRALRERMKALEHLALVPCACRPPFCAALERHEAAGASRADGVRLLQRRCRVALGRQASQFFPRTSCSMRLARVSAPTRRCNAAFSRSSVRRRLASETSIPPNCRRHRYNVGSAILC